MFVGTIGVTQAELVAILGVSVATPVTPPRGYDEWLEELNKHPADGSHRVGALARSKGFEPPTF